MYEEGCRGRGYDVCRQALLKIYNIKVSVTTLKSWYEQYGCVKPDIDPFS